MVEAPRADGPIAVVAHHLRSSALLLYRSTLKLVPSTSAKLSCLVTEPCSKTAGTSIKLNTQDVVAGCVGAISWIRVCLMAQTVMLAPFGLLTSSCLRQAGTHPDRCSGSNDFRRIHRSAAGDEGPVSGMPFPRQERGSEVALTKSPLSSTTSTCRKPFRSKSRPRRR